MCQSRAQSADGKFDLRQAAGVDQIIGFGQFIKKFIALTLRFDHATLVGGTGQKAKGQQETQPQVSG